MHDIVFLVIKLVYLGDLEKMYILFKKGFNKDYSNFIKTILE